MSVTNETVTILGVPVNPLTEQQALIDFIREKLATWNSTCESALVDQSALVDVPS